MKFEQIGFNFIEQCNNQNFVDNIEQYQYFTINSSEKIDIKFIPFLDFDQKYQVIYYNSNINNSTISYYANTTLSTKQLSDISRTIFTIEVIADYIKFLQFSNQLSTKQLFLHFWQVSFTNYAIKLEPADLFNRRK